MIGGPVNPQVAAQSDPGLFDKWRGWLSNPQNRSALLQTGLSLMNPVPGQGIIANVGQALGEGMAAAGRTESRLAEEALAEQALQRKIESEDFDREIKRSGLELDKLNTSSLIADREAGNRLASARLASDIDVNKAQIANYQSLGETREGGLELQQEAQRQKAEAAAAKTSLGQQRLALDKERLAAIKAGQADRARAIDARIRQIDAGIAQADQKSSAADAALGKVTLQSMFNRKNKIRDAVRKRQEAQSYSGGEKTVDELIEEEIALDAAVEKKFGGAGGVGSVPTSQLPQPKTKAERDALAPGTSYMAPDGSLRVRGQAGG